MLFPIIKIMLLYIFDIHHAQLDNTTPLKTFDTSAYEDYAHSHDVIHGQMKQFLAQNPDFH
jgi:hypothetical protein